jgi:hypothetical protein
MANASLSAGKRKRKIADGASGCCAALSGVGKSLTVATLTRIITHGLGESKNPKRPFMPVWGPVISKTQVADLVAYIRAESSPIGS